MKHLLTAALLLTPALAHAAPVKAIFGTQRFAPAQNHRVTGPLVQLQTQGGATLSFQHGAQFKITEDGAITLASGNLRIGPVATEPLTLTLPQGTVTVAPNTALTVTANSTKSTGRIYSGEVTAQGTTFSNGQGFIITPSGARGTFTPDAAQTPTFNAQQATTYPLIAYQQSQPHTPVVPPTEEPILPEAEEEPAITPPVTPPEDDDNEQPTTPSTPQPEDNDDTPTPPQPTDDEDTPTPPVTNPNPSTPTEPATPPVTSLPPVSIPVGNLIASFSESLNGVPMPDNSAAIASTFRLNEYANGLHELLQTETTVSGLNPIRLSIGTALQADTFSVGPTAGLGRWVGGELVRTSGRQTSLIQNFTVITEDNDTTILLPNSLHYVWGEKATNIPSSGRVTYSLAAATQPTYTGIAQAMGEGSFTGSLMVDFTTPVNSMVGTYHLNGTVTMPQTLQTDAGTTTTNVSYNIATNAAGAPLTSTSFNNPATLTVTAPTGAIACPSGCTGTINAAGFGNGMAAIGTLYAINPGGTVGINGAALFTAP